jgi:hypothetical protein
MRSRPALAVALTTLLSGAFARAADAGADAGAPVSPPSVGPEAPVSSPTYGSADIDYLVSGACGTDRCLLVWSGYAYSYAMPVDADGNPLRKAALILGGAVGQQSTAFIGGDFVVVTNSGGDVTLMRLGPDGAPVATNTVTLGAAFVSDVSVAWNGTHLLVAYRDGAGTGYSTYAVRFDTNLAPVDTPHLLETQAQGFAPLQAVAAGSDFVVVGGGTSAQAWAITDAGQVRAGPVAMPAELASGYHLVSANGAVIVLSASGNLMRLGTDLQVAATAPSGTGTGAALAWNGTSLLVAAGSNSGTGAGVSTRRFNLSLAASDQVFSSTPLMGAPLAFGCGSAFMLFGWSTGYTPDDYGVRSMALNSGGRARFTAATLVSVVALKQYNPMVAAQSSGFVVAAGQGQFQMAILPLGTDGRQVAGRAAAGLATYSLPRPIGLGAGPNGGVTFSGATLDPRIMEARFDALGQSLDAYPTEYATSATGMPGSLVWNGASYLWVRADTTTSVAADGTLSTSPKSIYNPASIYLSAGDAIGTSTLVAFEDGFQPGGASGLQLRVIRLDQSGSAIDAAPADVGPLSTAASSGIAVAHDAGHYLVAWDACTTESSGAVTSEIRAALIGANGQPAAGGSAMLRRATGAPPPDQTQANPAVHALTNPAVVFDGSLYWVLWREQGVWTRRLTTGGQVVDAQPIKLIDDPLTAFQVASRGDGSFVLIYDKLDLSPDVQSARLEARIVTASGNGGTGGTGGAGGTGAAGGAGGKVGAGGAGGKGGASGGSGASGLGGGAGAAATGGAGAGGGVGGLAGGTAGGGGASATAGTSGGAGGRSTGGAGGGGGSGGAAGGGVKTGSASSGCGCDVAAPNASGAAAMFLVALALIARRKRSA